MGLLVNWTQQRKESLSMKMGQYKLPPLKSREKKKTEKKNPPRIYKVCGTTIKHKPDHAMVLVKYLQKAFHHINKKKSPYANSLSDIT